MKQSVSPVCLMGEKISNESSGSLFVLDGVDQAPLSDGLESTTAEGLQLHIINDILKNNHEIKQSNITNRFVDNCNRKKTQYYQAI